MINLINWLIKVSRVDTNDISDGYHTFGELYEHRIELWIALCEQIEKSWHGTRVWRAKKHSDGSKFEGWFILGMDYLEGYQKTYHLPMSYWKRTNKFKTLNKSKSYDKHTPQDVIERIKLLT